MTPASDRQKAVAAEVIQLTRPWEQSTGPRTREGKAKVAANRLKKSKFQIWRSDFVSDQQYEQACSLALERLNEVFESQQPEQDTPHVWRRTYAIGKNYSWFRLSLTNF